MEKFCQSCTLPLENIEDRRTERDGSKSDSYCKYCYQNGAFTKPDMTLDQMMEMSKNQMLKQKLPENIIQLSMNMMPGLKRWKTASTSA